MSLFPIYYSTDDAEIIKARKVDEAAQEYVGRQGRAFADLFDAIPYFTGGLAPHLAGIGFDKDKDKPLRQPALWAPAIPGNPLRVPADPRKVPTKLRAQHKALVEKWNANFPQAAAIMRGSAMLDAFKVKAEQFVNGHQLHLFMEGDETMWVISTIPLDLHEVLATDLRAAQVRIEMAAKLKMEEAKVAVSIGEEAANEGA